jgi:hypothetical protein
VQNGDDACGHLHSRVLQGWIERLYGWMYFKVKGKRLDAEEEDDDENEEERHSDVEHDDHLQDGPGSEKRKKQELAMLDWVPWETRVEPVAAR